MLLAVGLLTGASAALHPCHVLPEQVRRVLWPRGCTGPLIRRWVVQVLGRGGASLRLCPRRLCCGGLHRIESHHHAGVVECGDFAR